MEEDEIIPYTFDLPMYMMPHKILGLRTGYYELNNLLPGWQRHEYVIVGYTNSEDANEFIRYNASASNRVGSVVAIISSDKDTSYSIIDSKLTIVLYDCDSIFDIRRRAIRLVKGNGIKVLIIDNITMINCEDQNLVQREMRVIIFHEVYVSCIENMTSRSYRLCPLLLMEKFLNSVRLQTVAT